MTILIINLLVSAKRLGGASWQGRDWEGIRIYWAAVIGISLCEYLVPVSQSDLYLCVKVSPRSPFCGAGVQLVWYEVNLLRFICCWSNFFSISSCLTLMRRGRSRSDSKLINLDIDFKKQMSITCLGHEWFDICGIVNLLFVKKNMIWIMVQSLKGVIILIWTICYDYKL